MNVRYAGRSVAVLALGLFILTGCQSKQDAAIEAAKKQAAATGQAQQVVSVDKNGNTVTTTAEPPAPGQTAQVVTTTVVPKTIVPANQPAVAPGQPAVAPGQPAVAGNGPYGAEQPQAAAAHADPRPAEIDLPRGTPLAIRINEHISVKSSRPGDRFDGEIAEPVNGPDGNVAIPRGTPVGGEIVAAHARGHFKGASILELRLTSLTLNGTQYPIETTDFARSKRGKGKRTAAFIGGGTGLGMLVGGLASGGTGMLIGGLAGAGAGTATGALTGNRDIEIPSESLLRFRLADDLVIRR